MKKPWNILLGAVLLASLALLAAVLHHYQLKAAEERYRASLKARGEPMDLAQALPPEQNSAESFLKACALMEKNETFLRTNPVYGEKMVAPGKAMISAARPDVREPGKFGYTNSWSEAQEAIEQNRECLELLREIADKPKLDFHIPYSGSFLDATFFTNQHLVELKKSVMLLASAAMVELHQGDSAAAIMNVQAALAIADAMQDQRLIISELVRIAIANIAQNRTWEILQSEGVSDSDLAALQNDWHRLNFTRSYKNALMMECITGDDMLARCRKSNAEIEKYLELYQKAYQRLGIADEEKPGIFARAKLCARIFMWRYWWSYPDELLALHGSEVLMETARSAETNAALGVLLGQQQAGLDALKLNASFDKLENPFLLLQEPDLHSMLSESVVTLSSCLRRVMAAETMKRMTVTAIALKRFQLRHGNYPEKLSELTPEFLATVPLDPVDGQPLRYRRNGDGTFTLYSVGENGKDDGGDPSLEKGAESSSFQWQNRHALDWVWPQPATEAEIQKYFDDQTKKSD